jgi:hypothetical protein
MSREGKKHVIGSRRMFAGMGCQTLACALAGSPIDFVSAAGFVVVHDNLISGFNLSCKVFLVRM